MGKHKAVKSSYIIPVDSSFLFYSPLVGLTALLNKKGVLELREQLLHYPKGQGNSESEFSELANDILLQDIQSPLEKKGDLNPDFLGIIPTRSCNGACNYCDFGADTATSEKMPYHLATKAVDWYAEIAARQKKEVLEVHFFGGEPMMAKDVVEVVVERARLSADIHKMIPYFEISTNGQYCTADAVYAGNYLNKVVLSLDGMEESHNLHRPLKGNFSGFGRAIETAKTISDSNAELCIRCCVSHNTVLLMEEFTEWLCKNLRISAINFEVMTASSLTKSKELFPPEPIDFAIHFQRSKDKARRYGIDVVYSSDIVSQPLFSSCPVGNDTAIISPDGRISNCYLLPERWRQKDLDLDLGKIKRSGEVYTDKRNIDSIRNMVKNKPECARCFCRWSCAGGCHVGNRFSAGPFRYSDFCRQTRIISAFTLLANLDMESEKEVLLTNKKAMEKVADNSSDLLEEFN